MFSVNLKVQRFLKYRWLNEIYGSADFCPHPYFSRINAPRPHGQGQFFLHPCLFLSGLTLKKLKWQALIKKDLPVTGIQIAPFWSRGSTLGCAKKSIVFLVGDQFATGILITSLEVNIKIAKL